MINRIVLPFTLGPVLIWLLCIAVVLFLNNVIGCTIHEGFANPCNLLGMDLAKATYGMGFFYCLGAASLWPTSGWRWHFMDPRGIDPLDPQKEIMTC